MRISSRGYRYGWIPDLPDMRDYPYIRLAVRIPVLPKKADISPNCTKVENQGELGSCTACALVGNLEFLKKKSFRKSPDFSRLFLYFNERVIRNTTDVDSGASIRDGIKSLVKKGDCTEKLWPYRISKFTLKPPRKCYEEALKYQILSYFRISTLEEMKHTLSMGFPFVFGFAVYESFETQEVARTGIVPMPEDDETMVGGHAVMAVGYDDGKKCFKVRNSWGAGWGDKGYFYMSYAYMKDRNLSADFWTIRDME